LKVKEDDLLPSGLPNSDIFFSNVFTQVWEQGFVFLQMLVFRKRERPLLMSSRDRSSRFTNKTNCAKPVFTTLNSAVGGAIALKPCATATEAA